MTGGVTNNHYVTEDLRKGDMGRWWHKQARTPAQVQHHLAADLDRESAAGDGAPGAPASTPFHTRGVGGGGGGGSGAGAGAGAGAGGAGACPICIQESDLSRRRKVPSRAAALQKSANRRQGFLAGAYSANGTLDKPQPLAGMLSEISFAPLPALTSSSRIRSSLSPRCNFTAHRALTFFTPTALLFGCGAGQLTALVPLPRTTARMLPHCR
ncbi:hypothetical protein GQ43DRAFT_435922 [Delitschia confertaspora ATCC 74209]|uniref:Uncharacterized protein n=1 Tax=Delitschia confertaspora ATCC 74209 TaxID=1513339 RepID=A0A9P4MR15_9PLEO|nr:hypothetical protein GQ43DRAFT_435922 [Delitschia confertaspora ATCC 74209]